MKLFGNRRSRGERPESHSAPQPDTQEIEISEINTAESSASDAGRKPNRKLRRAVTVVCIVIAVLAAALAVYAIWERPPAVAPGPVATDPPSTPVVSGPETPNTPQTGGDAPEEVYEGEAPSIAFTSDHKSGVYTILLVGVDRASNSTDTILVGSFDTTAHTIHCVSIPRDTLINIGWSTTPKRINAVYPGYTNSGGSGIDGLKTHIKNLLGFDVDCYAVVYLKAVEDAVNAIGGVWFDVPQDMYYWDPTQDLTITIDKGYQLLDGENALKLCRFRDGYAGGDIQRIDVQHDFLKALVDQMLSLGNIPNLSDLISVLMEDIDTDLSAANLAWFARQFLKCSMEDVTFETMPYANGCTINGVSFVSIDVNAWLEMVNRELNPYEDDVTVSNVNILNCNGYGTYVSATNGVVAGGVDSFYCLPCTVKAGAAVHHAPGACPADVPAETPTGPEIMIAEIPGG